MNPWLVRPLSEYAIEMGFQSETERLELILDVPQYQQDALEVWMDADGTKAGLLAILNTKRPVRRDGPEL